VAWEDLSRQRWPIIGESPATVEWGVEGQRQEQAVAHIQLEQLACCTKPVRVCMGDPEVLADGFLHTVNGSGNFAQSSGIRYGVGMATHSAGKHWLFFVFL
jgi:Na+-translocating ferredoxin:NAD+ oxidoreductase RNF subunit RnfB